MCLEAFAQLAIYGPEQILTLGAKKISAFQFVWYRYITLQMHFKVFFGVTKLYFDSKVASRRFAVYGGDNIFKCENRLWIFVKWKPEHQVFFTTLVILIHFKKKVVCFGFHDVLCHRTKTWVSAKTKIVKRFLKSWPDMRKIYYLIHHATLVCFGVIFKHIQRLILWFFLFYSMFSL